MLVDKLRGKFDTNDSKNSILDKIIIKEVNTIMSSGNPSEASLMKLDLKLRDIADAIKNGKKCLAGVET